MFSDLKFPLSLGSDNHSGVHPKVMEALIAANRGHAHSYGMDPIALATEKEFKRVFGEPLDIEYVFNGTGANVLAIKTLLQSFESALVSDVSHMQVDECGAPELLTGCKLIPVPTRSAKITPENLKPFLIRKGDQHFSQPRLLSLTQPTELGTCYSLDEIRELKKLCNEHNLFLHIDGARLPNAAAFLNVSLKQLTRDLGVDVLSFGGTKNGLMGAEAIVFFNPLLSKNLRYHRKQALQLPSKSRFLAAQFYAFLKNDLYKDIASHVHALAKALEKRLQKFPEIEITEPVQSNALFVKIPKAWIKPLKERYFFYVWDENTSVLRWMFSFDFKAEDIDDIVRAIEEVKSK